MPEFIKALKKGSKKGSKKNKYPYLALPSNYPNRAGEKEENVRLKTKRIYKLFTGFFTFFSRDLIWILLILIHLFLYKVLKNFLFLWGIGLISGLFLSIS